MKYLPLLLLTSCSTTTLIRQLDGKPHRSITRKLFGWTYSHTSSPLNSVIDNSREVLASYGEKLVIGGIVCLIASFAFSAAIKSYTGQDVANGLVLGSGCAICAGIGLIMAAAWWWYLVAALATALAYAGCKWYKDKGVL